jgi:hypothetical protein
MAMDKVGVSIAEMQRLLDLPPKDVPHLKLELCHFLFLNANMPVALEDGNSMNYAA